MRHYENSATVLAPQDEVFAYVDDHANFSSHMNKSSWMMGGGKMKTESDNDHGQKVGSHISMSGKVLGIKLFLDEVVTKHQSPHRKSWETVGNLNLLVIGHYQMGFEINPSGSNSKFKVYIDYELPNSRVTRLLGYLFGGTYAKWCVEQMVSGVTGHFERK